LIFNNKYYTINKLHRYDYEMLYTNRLIIKYNNLGT